MNVVDANVLLYAVNTSAEHHEQSRSWLDGQLSGRSTTGFAWIALLAFIRLSTKPGLFPSPLSVDGALDRVDAWLAQPTSVVLEPSASHGQAVRSLLAPLGAGGNLANDAHLAALALQHKATVVTYDSDFGRFPGIAWRLPTA